MSNDGSAMVAVNGLCKAFGEGEARVVVLDGLDFSVDDGELVAVVGPSGIGKSTLLHLIGLLDRQDAGTVELGGRDIGDLGAPERAHLRNEMLGFVFQHHHLLDELDARDNVALPLRIAGRTARAARGRAEALLDQVGLSDRGSHFPDQLSGGEQQRVAIARALVMGPRLLLADEPTGNLDRQASEVVFDLVRRLHREEGLTSIIVTHNESMAERCDRIFTLARTAGSKGAD